MKPANKPVVAAPVPVARETREQIAGKLYDGAGVRQVPVPAPVKPAA